MADPVGQKAMDRRSRVGGRGRDTYPKGRQVHPEAVETVRRILGDTPRQRDLLIEDLHGLQDALGGLRMAHLAALAEEHRLAMAEVYEVATFYAHFDVLEDDAQALPAVTVRVCDSLTCEMFGAKQLEAELKQRLEPGTRILTAPCMGRCDCAPVAEVGHRHVDRADAAAVEAHIRRSETHPVIPAYPTLDDYRAAGGYRVLEECLAGSCPPETVIAALDDSRLRGLGGAGFPTGQKWTLVRQQPEPRLLAINADEGEPGTFKDRFYLERDPHRFLEGMLIAAWVIDADAIYIYLRDEYPAVREILLRELALLDQTDLTAGRQIHLRRGAGAYICGEESAMIESLEGKRGLPRHKPPYPGEVGLFGRPTLVNNVETLFWVRDILELGAERFASQGRNGRQGVRSYSVSGRVNNPGVKLAPAGITMQELLNEYCGGMQPGHRFKGYLPGGASGGILPAHLDRLPLDFGTLEPYGCFIGSAAIIVLSDQDDTKDVARNLMRFFSYESCGQCTPCRLGTEKALALMDPPQWDEVLLSELSEAMADASICGLGQAAPNPVLSVLKYFPEDLPQSGGAKGT